MEGINVKDMGKEKKRKIGCAVIFLTLCSGWVREKEVKKKKINIEVAVK